MDNYASNKIINLKQKTMEIFSKKKKEETKPAKVDLQSMFMNDETEGDHGKEAMLDYQLSYLLRLASTYETGFGLGQRTLLKLIEEKYQLNEIGYIDNVNFISVKVWKQWQKIDLIAEVEVDFDFGGYKSNIEHHVIVIENKAYTGIHDDQLSRYSQVVEDWYKDKDVKIHYWVVTFYDNDTNEFEAISNQCHEANGNWKCISFEDVVDLTDDERVSGTGNEIIDEFWIKKWY
jgi:hypothetical protein